MLRVVDSLGRNLGPSDNLVSEPDGGLQPQDARSRGIGDGATVPTWGILAARVAVKLESGSTTRSDVLVRLETSGQTVCSGCLRPVANVERVSRSLHQWERPAFGFEFWNFHCWRSSSLQVHWGLQLGQTRIASVRSSAVLGKKVPAVSDCYLPLRSNLQQ